MGSLKLTVASSYTKDSSSSTFFGHATFSTVAKKQLAMICAHGTRMDEAHTRLAHVSQRVAKVEPHSGAVVTMSKLMAEANAVPLQMSLRLSRSGLEKLEASTWRMSSAAVGSRYAYDSPKALANSCSTSSTVLNPWAKMSVYSVSMSSFVQIDRTWRAAHTMVIVRNGCRTGRCTRMRSSALQWLP